jgi:cytoskeleton protein RodZ
VTTTPGIGEYLAQQRRLRGISVDELCEMTKIPRRNLERLESGAFDAQPDGFARGFVRTVAAALGLDPDEAVMRLMQEPEADAAVAVRGVGRLAGWAAVLLGVAGVAMLSWWLLGGSGAPVEPAERPPLTYRPDVIGDLAREREPDAPGDADAQAQAAAPAPGGTDAQAPPASPAPGAAPAPAP